MAHHLRLAKSEQAARRLGDWAETETSQDILRSLHLVRSSERPSLTMIAGAPGVGKTSTIIKFMDSIPKTPDYVPAVCGEGTAWNLAISIRQLWPISYRPHFNTMAEAREVIAQALAAPRLTGEDHTRPMLIIDEAQYLHQRHPRTGQMGEAFEWLRQVSEQARCDLVFCGDHKLPGILSDFPQLQSRMIRPVVIGAVSKTDVAAFVAGTSFADPQCINALYAIARMKGGFRNIVNVTRIACLFAGHDAPGPDHLKAAIADMKLAPKGGGQ